MWLFLALILRPILKLLSVVIVFWFALSLVQILTAIPVAAWEALSGSRVPQEVYHGLCIVIFVSCVFRYLRRRRRSRRSA
ncbi:MAG: hypothetical protein ACE5G0_17145 [Rhodothermales bacterium]